MSVATADDAKARVESRGLSASVIVTLIAIGALALRVAWLVWHGPSEITWDGAEYARIAANLAAGHGYIGMRGTTMFVFPPLYPLAIAALLPLSGSVASAGVNVSLLSGAAFVFPVYGIGALCYGRRAGTAAAVIAAVLPFVVQISTVVLADMLFLTLAGSGMYFLLRLAHERRIVDAVACGASFGLAYLARPEGVLLWGLALCVALAPLVMRPVNGRRAAALVLATAVGFIVLAAPYVVFLSSHAHHVRIEGKSVLNLDIGLRMRRGLSYTEAADAIDRNLVAVGPELAQDYYFEPAHRAQPPLGTVLAFGLGNLVRHVREIGHVVVSRLNGTALLALLALGGFCAGPWSRRRIGNQLILVAYGVVIMVSLASVYHFWDRYFVGFVLLLVVWAGNGVEAVARRVDRARPSSGLRRLPLAIVGLMLMALLFSNKVRFVDDAQSLVELDAGSWLAAHGGDGARILSISDQAVFYANGVWWMLPAAPDRSTALRYVRAVDPDFIVLDDDYAAERPYVSAWLKSGIPDPHARVVYALHDPDSPDVAVVRWTREGSR